MLDWLRQDPCGAPTLNIAGVALPLVIRRHPRARRMTLRLAPDGSEARITIPQWGRTAEAIAFAQSRQDWLARQLASVPRHEPVGPGGKFRYRGLDTAVDHAPDHPRKPQLADGAVRLGGPETSVPGRLRRWLESEARLLMGADLQHYCTRAEQAVPILSLSSAQRRWGSCSPGGGIRINWRLVMAPDFVRRSVVAHEVAHLVHFDHSPRFHSLLGDLFEEDITEANDWLRREGRTLYQPFG